MRLAPPLARGWRAAPGATISRTGPTSVRVGRRAGMQTVLGPPSADLTEVLEALPEGVSECDAARRLNAGELARFLYYAERLTNAGALALDVLAGERCLATLVPRRWELAGGEAATGADEVVLSRFAYLRRVDGHLLLAVPGAACEVVLVDEQASAWVSSCARPQALDDDADELRGAFLALLLRAGLLQLADATETEAMQTWEFHDRLFHHAGRAYRDGVARGATWRFGDGHLAPAAARMGYDGRVRELPGPRATSNGRPLRQLMESRRSQRDMSGAPVTVEELSELLHRTARTVAVEPDGITRRPYPSAGSLHELELYLAVGTCRDLERGFYHYRGDEHALVSLGATGPSEAMLADCARAWQQPGRPPQVLVLIASRLPRLASKYEGYAYRLSLMNAGVLIANLQLVLTDMGLAGAAAGSGDPDLFAAATGADSWEETSIAEFGFGRAGA